MAGQSQEPGQQSSEIGGLWPGTGYEGSGPGPTQLSPQPAGFIGGGFGGAPSYAPGFGPGSMFGLGPQSQPQPGMGASGAKTPQQQRLGSAFPGLGGAPGLTPGMGAQSSKA